MRGTVSLLAAMLMLLSLTGCASPRFKGGDGEPADRSADWPFTPRQMRLHPFTRIERAGGSRPVLRAWVEFRDQLGHVTKGVGRLRFELYSAPDGEDAETQRRLHVWRAKLETVEQNDRHYDPVTRTYLFRLKLDQPPPEDQPLELMAQLTAPGDRRLRANTSLKYDPDSEAASRPDAR